jgi:hypothetical protein
MESTGNMGHNRKLVLGGVGLVDARFKHDISAMNHVRDELEQVVIDSDFIQGAPFRWIGLIIRLGLKNETEPHYKRIDKKDGELPIAIEVDSQPLIGGTFEDAVNVIRGGCVNALLHVAEKFNLNASGIRHYSEQHKGFKA